MNADHLLSRLDRVRQVGSGKWLARCPAHDDGNPSLSIKDAGDKLLVHCFAGCGKDDILSAIGLRYGDLFEGGAPERERDTFLDRALLALYESDRAAGRKFTPQELQREREAWLRVHRGQ